MYTYKWFTEVWNEGTIVAHQEFDTFAEAFAFYFPYNPCSKLGLKRIPDQGGLVLWSYYEDDKLTDKMSDASDIAREDTPLEYQEEINKYHGRIALLSQFTVIDHGVEHEQYFQGCGVANTQYDYCVTGLGDSEEEAFSDALRLLLTDYGVTHKMRQQLFLHQGQCSSLCTDLEEHHYYVSILAK